MAEKLSSAEVLDVLLAIERGEITLKTDKPPVEVWAGDCRYEASNGWVLVVFNDCGEWDYLDHATSPDGREWDFDDGSIGDAVRSYRGPCDASECYRLWGIPEYCSPAPDGEPWLGTMPA